MNGTEFIRLMEDMEYGEKVALYFKDRDQHARVMRDLQGWYWIITTGALSVIVDQIIDPYRDGLVSIYNHGNYLGAVNVTDVEYGKVL